MVQLEQRARGAQEAAAVHQRPGVRQRVGAVHVHGVQQREQRLEHLQLRARDGFDEEAVGEEEAVRGVVVQRVHHLVITIGEREAYYLGFGVWFWGQGGQGVGL